MESRKKDEFCVVLPITDEVLTKSELESLNLLRYLTPHMHIYRCGNPRVVDEKQKCEYYSPLGIGLGVCTCKSLQEAIEARNSRN